MKLVYCIFVFILLASCSKPPPGPTVDISNKFLEITPKNSTYEFTSLAFWGKQSGFVATGSGNMLLTTDGGDNWEEEVISDGVAIKYLYVFNANTGFCANQHNEIYKFDGSKWSEYNFPVKNARPGSFFMLNNQLIFATTLLGQNDLSYLVRSSDGGNIWDTIFTYRGNLAKIIMTDSKTGFIAGNSPGKISIAKTTDSGSSWYGKIPAIYGTYFSGTAQIKQIKAIDSNHIIAIGRGSEVYEGFILTSADAGENWDIALTNYALNDFDITATDIYFVGDRLFAAKVAINSLTLQDANSITNKWVVYDRETRFVKSTAGEPVLHYHNITGVEFPNDSTGYITTKNSNAIYRITL